MLWEASPVPAGTGSVPAQLVVLDGLFVLDEKKASVFLLLSGRTVPSYIYIFSFIKTETA